MLTLHALQQMQLAGQTIHAQMVLLPQRGVGLCGTLPGLLLVTASSTSNFFATTPGDNVSDISVINAYPTSTSVATTLPNCTGPL